MEIRGPAEIVGYPRFYGSHAKSNAIKSREYAIT